MLVHCQLQQQLYFTTHGKIGHNVLILLDLDVSPSQKYLLSFTIVSLEAEHRSQSPQMKEQWTFIKHDLINLATPTPKLE